MTTHRFGFYEMPHAFELMRDKGERIIKPLVVFPKIPAGVG